MSFCTANHIRAFLKLFQNFNWMQIDILTNYVNEPNSYYCHTNWFDCHWMNLTAIYEFTGGMCEQNSRQRKLCQKWSKDAFD